MPRELPLFDALVPTLLLILIVSGVIYLVLDRLVAEWDLDHYVWHPSLFRFSLFVCLFCSLGLWWYR